MQDALYPVDFGEVGYPLEKEQLKELLDYIAIDLKARIKMNEDSTTSFSGVPKLNGRKSNPGSIVEENLEGLIIKEQFSKTETIIRFSVSQYASIENRRAYLGMYFNIPRGWGNNISQDQTNLIANAVKSIYKYFKEHQR